MLRVLEERQITPVGSTVAQTVDVRIIAATHRDLKAMVQRQEFREDLLYRLRVVELFVPPLRERRDDIIPLVRFFLTRLSQREQRKQPSLSDRARSALLHHAWPGNVRELRNAVERALVVCDGEVIELRHLPPEVSGLGREAESSESLTPFSIAKEKATAQFSRDFLSAALERNEGNVSRTARELGIHRQSLQKMLRRLGLDRGEE